MIDSDWLDWLDLLKEAGSVFVLEKNEMNRALGHLCVHMG